MWNLNVLMLTSISLASVCCNVTPVGQCDYNFDVVKKFDVEKFSGRWYEMSRIPSSLQHGDCVVTNFSMNGTSSYIITETAVNNEKLTTVETKVSVDEKGKGILTLNSSKVISSIFVMGTDYTEYALLYSCSNISGYQMQIYSWVLSRSRYGLTDVAETIIDRLIDNNSHLQKQHYRSTKQDYNACFYYPVFDKTPDNIIMPFTCPENIRGVANFNNDEYLGRWFEIARYPTTNHKGQCNRGIYKSNQHTNKITFSYDEVVNETLITHLASAKLFDNSTGHFIVEVEDENGVPVSRKFDYYVIATDYTSYSLVYSCENLDDGTSLVNVWKRSRAHFLTPEANIAINDAIHMTRGITNEYFQITSQTDDDCFFIPPVSTPMLPIFRGRCEQNITGVEGFDMNRYLGWWHEMEGYTILTDGQCRSSKYTRTENRTSYRVEEILVRNNNGFVNEADVIVSSNGRLSRYLIGNVFQDVWVLATDYETYSLLYSCENFENDWRKIWSAIHSKKRDRVSAEVKAALAPIIAKNKVLREELYFPVDQSDAACFHYPSISGGNIIIPGQCDLDIAAVKNFNITMFSGDWFYIESYDDYRPNSCVGSRFTVHDDNNTIDVLNYIVRFSQLVIVNGTARIVSTDGSGRIQLRMTGSGARNLDILATDYTNYALVYSCRNLNLYERQVFAWKLSRTRTMTSAGNIAINAIMQQRVELHAPYFKTILQNDSCPKPNSSDKMKNSIIILLLFTFLEQFL